MAKDASAPTRIAARFATAATRWIGLLSLCAAYLQGGFNKTTDFPGAIAEMQHFGLSPERPFAIAVIALELVVLAMILTSIDRWLGALALAAFTLMATFVALRIWEMAPPVRFMASNAFFEHLGLFGGFLLVAWHDLRERVGPSDQQP
ncbi:MAG: DoxX family protein [Bosea sp. (in: a-proteobacteria)]